MADEIFRYIFSDVSVNCGWPVIRNHVLEVNMISLTKALEDDPDTNTIEFSPDPVCILPNVTIDKQRAIRMPNKVEEIPIILGIMYTYNEHHKLVQRLICLDGNHRVYRSYHHKRTQATWFVNGDILMKHTAFRLIGYEEIPELLKEII